MIKILFDTQVFDWQINGGISRYFIEVLKRIDKKENADILFKCVHSYNTYIRDTKWLIRQPVLKQRHFPGKLRIVKQVNEKINRGYSNNCLKKGYQDIFHPTYYDPYFLRFIGEKPFVLTVHDLTNEKFPDESNLTKKMLGWKAELIHKASHIIAVSENTRQDVINYYKVAPDKITTAHLASPFQGSDTLVNSTLDPSITSLPYILFVGSRAGYKNFKTFVKEVAPVIKKENLRLVIAGGGPLTAQEHAFIKENNIDDRVIGLSHISDELLISLYANALIFVFPSLYEGFGIPAIEAMQFGCPVLLSNNSSLPEVGGTAATYFDPFQEGDLQKKLVDIIFSKEERIRKSIEGKQQVKKFNWDTTADIHMQVYQKILQ